MTLTGIEIVSLMRRYKVTMRAIKSKYAITLKRTREVRAKGASGVAAENWVFMITGAWPVSDKICQ